MSLCPFGQAVYYPVLLHKTLKKSNVILKIDAQGFDIQEENIKIQYKDVSISVEKDTVTLNKKVSFQINQQPIYNFQQFMMDVKAGQYNFRKDLDKPIDVRNLLKDEQASIQARDDGIIINSIGSTSVLRLNATTSIQRFKNLLFFSSFECLQSAFEFKSEENLDNFASQLEKVQIREMGSLDSNIFIASGQVIQTLPIYEISINNENRKIQVIQHYIVLNGYKVAIDSIKTISYLENQLILYFYDLQKWKIKSDNLQQLLMALFDAGQRGFLAKLRFGEIVHQQFQQLPLSIIDENNFSHVPLQVPYLRSNKSGVASTNIDILRVVLQFIGNYKSFAENQLVSIENIVGSASNLQKLIFLTQLVEFKVQYENKSAISQYLINCYSMKHCNSFDELSKIELENYDMADRDSYVKCRHSILNNLSVQKLLNQTIKFELEVNQPFGRFVALRLCKALLGTNHPESQQLARHFITQQVQQLNLSAVESTGELQLLSLELIQNFLKLCSNEQLKEFLYFFTSEATVLRMFQFVIQKSGFQFVVIDLICQLAAKLPDFVRLIRQIFPPKLAEYLVLMKINEFITVVNTNKGVYTCEIVWDEKISAHIIMQLEDLYISYQSKKVDYAFNFSSLHIQIVGISSHPLSQYHIDIGCGIYLSGLIQLGVDNNLLLLVGEDYQIYNKKIENRATPILQFLKTSKIETEDIIKLLWRQINSQNSKHIVCGSYLAITLIILATNTSFQYYEQLVRKVINNIYYSDYNTSLYALSLLEIICFQVDEEDYTKRNLYIKLGQSDVVILICAKILPLVIYDNFRNNCQNIISDEVQLIHNGWFGKLVVVGLRILVNTVKANPANDPRGKPYYPHPIIYQTILSKSIIPHFLALLLASFMSNSTEMVSKSQLNLNDSNDSKPATVVSQQIDNYQYVEDYYGEIVIQTLILLKQIAKQSKNLSQTVLDYGFVEVALSNPLGHSINRHVFEFLQEIPETRQVVERIMPRPFVNLIYKYPSKEIATIFCADFYVTLQVIWSSSMRYQLQQTINPIAGMLLESMKTVAQSNIETTYLQDYDSYIKQQQSFLPIIVFQSFDQHPIVQQYDLLQYCFCSGELYLNLFSKQQYNYLVQMANPMVYKTYEEVMEKGFSLTHPQINNTVKTLLNITWLDDKNYENFVYSFNNLYLFGSLLQLIQKMFYLLKVGFRSIGEMNQQIGQINPALKDQLETLKTNLKQQVCNIIDSFCLIQFVSKLVNQKLSSSFALDEEFAAMIDVYQLIIKDNLFNTQDYKIAIASSMMVELPIANFIQQQYYNDNIQIIQKNLVDQLPNFLQQLVINDGQIQVNFLQLSLDLISDVSQLNVPDIMNCVFQLLYNSKPVILIKPLIDKLLKFDVNLQENILYLLVVRFYKCDTDCFPIIQQLLSKNQLTKIIYGRYQQSSEYKQLLQQEIFEIDYVQNEYIFHRFEEAVNLFVTNQLGVKYLNFKYLNAHELVMQNFYASVLIKKLLINESLNQSIQEQLYEAVTDTLSSSIKNVQNTDRFLFFTLCFICLKLTTEKNVGKFNDSGIVQYLYQQCLCNYDSVEQLVLQRLVISKIVKFSGIIKISVLEEHVNMILNLQAQEPYNLKYYVDLLPVLQNQYHDLGLQQIAYQKLQSYQVRTSQQFFNLSLADTIMDQKSSLQYDRYFLKILLTCKQQDDTFLQCISILSKMIHSSKILQEAIPYQLQILITNQNSEAIFNFINSDKHTTECLWSTKIKQQLILFDYSNNCSYLDFQTYIDSYKSKPCQLLFPNIVAEQLLMYNQQNPDLLFGVIKDFFKTQPSYCQQFLTEEWKQVFYNNLGRPETYGLWKQAILNASPDFKLSACFDANDTGYFVEQICQQTGEQQLAAAQIACCLITSDETIRVQFAKTYINQLSGLSYVVALILDGHLPLSQDTRKVLSFMLAQIATASREAFIDVFGAVKQQNYDLNSFNAQMQTLTIPLVLSDSSLVFSGDVDTGKVKEVKAFVPSLQEQLDGMLKNAPTIVPDKAALMDYAAKNQKPIKLSIEAEAEELSTLSLEMAYVMLTQSNGWTVYVDQMMGW